MELEKEAWQPLRINIRNLINDFLEMYSAEPEEVMITESIANSLDAQPNRIEIGLSEKPDADVFSIVDDGSGMSESTFQNNYHALALSTKEKGLAIGFAGVGGKLYLAMLQAGHSIYTETKSDSFWGASELGMKGDEASWRRMEPRGRLKTKTGTYIEVEIRKGVLDKERVERVVQENYGAVLVGMRGNTSIYVVWKPERLLPWMPARTVDSELFSFRVRGKKCIACFWLSRDDFDAAKGIDIAVLGKKVKGEQWFNLQFEVKPEFSKRVYGIVNADVLAKLLTANKQDLRGGNDGTWQEFRRRAGRVFRRWLFRIGAIQKSSVTPAPRPGERAMTREVTRAIVEVLGLPGLRGYRLGLGKPERMMILDDVERRWRRRDGEGGREQGGSGSGAGPDNEGEARRVAMQVGGGGAHLKAQAEKRSQKTAASRARGQGQAPRVTLTMSHQPGTDEEAWIGPEGIVINTAHPVFRRSRDLGSSMEATHMIRCAFMALMENADPSKKRVLDELRSFYKGWAKVSAGPNGEGRSSGGEGG